MTTYTIYPIDNWIVATVAHCQPMTAEEDYVDVLISEKKSNDHKYKLFISISLLSLY